VRESVTREGEERSWERESERECHERRRGKDVGERE